MGGLRRWWRRRPDTPSPVPSDDGTGVVVAGCFDPAGSDSAVVARACEAGLEEGGPVLLRHHLRLASAEAAAAVATTAAVDGWVAVVEDPAVEVPGRPASALHPDLPVRLRLSAPRPLTARDLARERARMAGLAQRGGGDVEGYDLLVVGGDGPGISPRG